MTPVLPVWPGETVVAGGARLHVRRAPALSPYAEPAVFVHGLGGAATNWTDLMGQLRDQLDGYAPDLPGFGWSDPPADRDYAPAGHARAIVGLIESHVAAGPVHLFGNSLGGAVAVRVAALRPDLVRSLVLVSPALPAYRVRRSNAHLPALATPWIGEKLARRLGRVSVERRVRAALALCYADPSVVPPSRLAEAVAEARRRSALGHDGEAVLRSLQGVLRTYLERGEYSPWQLATRVRAPTLLVYGLLDRLVDPRTAARAMRTFPDARLVELPRSGHVAQMEHPALVAHVVREHLGRLGRGATGRVDGDPGPAALAGLQARRSA